MLQDGEGEGWRSAFLRSFQGSPCCWSKDCALSSEERVYKQPAGCSHSRVWIQKPNSPVALRRSAWQCRLLCWAVSPACSSAPARWPALGGFFLQSGFRSPVSAYKLFPHSKSVPNPSCAAESLVKLSFFFFSFGKKCKLSGVGTRYFHKTIFPGDSTVQPVWRVNVLNTTSVAKEISFLKTSNKQQASKQLALQKSCC